MNRPTYHSIFFYKTASHEKWTHSLKNSDSFCNYRVHFRITSHEHGNLHRAPTPTQRPIPYRHRPLNRYRYHRHHRHHHQHRDHHSFYKIQRVDDSLRRHLEMDAFWRRMAAILWLRWTR